MLPLLSRHRFVLLVVAVVFALDQVTKFIVIQTIPLRSSWPDTGFFRFTHIGNTGSAFGLFGGQNFVLIVASFVGVVILLAFYRSHPHPTLAIKGSLGLMLAGALGNLVDRLINGHVTDFIDVGPWYIFNIADSAIVVGIAILGFTILTTKDEPKAEHDDEEADLSATNDEHAGTHA